MLEDSIISSPSKANTSIHKVRLLRRTKRKQQVDCENDQIDLQNALSAFYFDSEENSNLIASNPLDSTFSIPNPTSVVYNYRPFQLEKSYVIADHVASNTSTKLKSIQKETQGFLTCQRLTESEPSVINATPENTSFSITETELIACCNQVEKKFCNIPSRTKERSPVKDDVSLVNSILEDFSQSPLGKEQITNHMSWQCTPEYRLRRKPLKTYSRQFLNKTRTDLSKRFNTQYPPVSDEEHDNNSSCSSLSVQEDNGLIENVSNAPVSSSDTSQRLCENLLNLSVYFTQNDQCTMYTDAIQQSCFNELIPGNRVRDLIQEILHLRDSYRDFKDSNDSLEDFYGFSDCINFERDGKVLQSNTRSNLNQTVSNPSEITFSPNKAYGATANSEGIDFLTGWNGQEIFACINTEEIIDEHNKYLVSKQISQVEDCNKVNQISYKTSKPPEIVSKPPEIPMETKEATSSNCDNINFIEDGNLFDNLEDCELNDDCDLFLNFQTPITLNEQRITGPLDEVKSVLIPPPELQHPQSHAANVPCNSKIIKQGFKTASGKNVSISKKAQACVEKLLNEFNTELDENYNCYDLREMKKNIYDKMHIKKANVSINDANIEKNYNVNQLMESTRIENGMKKNVGFQTANGKNIKISAKAQESVKQLLSNIALDTQDNLDSDLLFMKKQIVKKNLELKGLNPPSTLKRDETDEANKLHTDTKVINAVTPIIESVHEANNNVNKEQIEASHSLENNMFENNTDFDDIILSKLPFVNPCENPISNRLENDTKERDLLKIGAPAGRNLNVKIGFQTANGKKVSISAKAQQAAKKLLQDVAEIKILDVNNTTEMESKLKEIKNNLINKNKQLKKENSSSKPIASQTCPNNMNNTSDESFLSHLNYNAEDNNKSKRGITMELNSLNINIGFKTANDKSLSISANAQSAVQKLLQEFETDLDAETYESNLEKLKIDIKNKNKVHNNVKCIETQNYSQEINEYANIVLSEWPLNDTVLNTTPIVKNAKRKYSINKSDTTLADDFSPPPSKILKKSLHNTKSSLVEQSLKSPLTRATNSVILRKNLLSLTKTRKNRKSSMSNVNEGTTKLNQERHEEKFNAITPIKTISSAIDSNITPATPNFREFFSNAPDTSTPRNGDNVCKSTQIINDSDFKPIQWNVNNNDNDSNLNKSQTQSTHTTKITESSSSNITLNSSNPTAKERIGRLKMYGKAPDISPILIDTHNTHNCRPSGLRRTRSMFKKSENN